MRTRSHLKRVNDEGDGERIPDKNILTTESCRHVLTILNVRQSRASIGSSQTLYERSKWRIWGTSLFNVPIFMRSSRYQEFDLTCKLSEPIEYEGLGSW